MGKIEAAVAEIAALLTAQGKTIATAESTTGGYIGHLLNSVPGSSRYFVGGVTAYANMPKAKVLRVPQAVLEQEGSVSAQCVLAMAQGVRELMDTDIGVAESGVAGPGGGRGDKPVGTVFMAIACRDGYALAERSVFGGGRQAFKEETAEAVFSLVRHYLERQSRAEQPPPARA
ncbi:MAG: CinA family protein [Dehalococcoidia bacterium]|nr:CinA family protein [Dehalococcoidia bacterium]